MAQQEGNAIYIMIFVVAFFCVAAPVFRSTMLDLMWILPLSMSADSNNGGADNSIATTAQYQRKAEVNLSASIISKIGAISAQIDMPFCNEV